MTGPNIASQELLFSQLADRIGGEDGSNAIVVNLRSGDATNLKAVLKKLARDATNEEHEDEDEKLPTSANDVRATRVEFVKKAINMIRVRNY